jgi:hypothetical protein
VRTRIAALAALVLALAGCGTADGEDEASADTGVVLDKPWVLLFEFDNDDAGYIETIYLRVTPETGEVTERTLPAAADDLPSKGTLVDASGAWALGSHEIDDDGDTIYSLTGADDVALDPRGLTPRPEAWAFVPGRPGVLHVLDKDDSLVEYALETGKTRNVELPAPGPGMEYLWYFSAADGMPVATKRGIYRADVGEFTPYDTTPVDVEGGCAHAFEDAAGTTWDVCMRGRLLFRTYDGSEWTLRATVDELPPGTLKAVLPAAAESLPTPTAAPVPTPPKTSPREATPSG